MTSNDIYSHIQAAVGVKPEEIGAKFAEKRLIPLQGRIDSDMAEGVCKTLLAFEVKKIAPITLIIASSGGSVPAGDRIIGIISSLRSPVDALVIGRTGSMAIDILLSCRVRRSLPGSELFVHYSHSNFDVVNDGRKMTAQEKETLQRRMQVDIRSQVELYSRRLKCSMKEVHRLLRTGGKYDRWYSAREAKSIGLIDEIVTDFKLFAPPVSAKK